MPPEKPEVTGQDAAGNSVPQSAQNNRKPLGFKDHFLRIVHWFGLKNHLKGRLFEYICLGLFTGLIFSLLIFTVAPLLRDTGYSAIDNHTPHIVNDVDVKKLKNDSLRLKRSIKELNRQISLRTPQKPYMIIDSMGNRFSLMAGKKILYQSICSCGNYILLKTRDGERKWLFKTPRGRFTVRNIVEDPVWRMPDWVFIEEGLPVPPPDAAGRFETNVLGEFGFDLGNGYLIHGTLYKRELGLPVTHGCIRLGDQELETVHRHLSIGSKVFIY